MVGVDVFDGSTSQLREFKNWTTVTFPLLLHGNSGYGFNVQAQLGDRDNYVIVNKQGIVRYHAQLHHQYGGRLFVDEVRGCIDSLVTQQVDVDPGSVRDLALGISPNPFRRIASISLALPAASERALVTVHDLAGRHVVTLWDGPTPAGITRLTWDGRDERGLTTAPGVYLLRTQAGGARITRRMVRIE